MPVKPGDLMATAPGQVPTTVSGGKRMRVLWVEGDGDGDSSSSLMGRCRSTVRGHPTWKIFCSDVASPIVRSKNEPPHYIYLDDRACYDVLASNAYTKRELRAFWPFDFDNMGNVRTGRVNRGRPAYLDNLCTESAKGPMRNTTKQYEFLGAPDVLGENSYARLIRKMKVEDSVAAELTTGADMHTKGSLNNMKYWNLESPSNARILYEPRTPTRYELGPTDGSLKPLGMVQKAMQGSPYFEMPCSNFRSRPRFRPGDLAARLGVFNPKRTLEEVFPMYDGAIIEGTPSLKKKKLIQPFDLSLPCAIPDTPESKGVKVEGEDEELTPSEQPKVE